MSQNVEGDPAVFLYNMFDRVLPNDLKARPSAKILSVGAGFGGGFEAIPLIVLLGRQHSELVLPTYLGIDIDEDGVKTAREIQKYVIKPRFGDFLNATGNQGIARIPHLIQSIERQIQFQLTDVNKLAEEIPSSFDLILMRNPNTSEDMGWSFGKYSPTRKLVESSGRLLSQGGTLLVTGSLGEIRQVMSWLEQFATRESTERIKFDEERISRYFKVPPGIFESSIVVGQKVRRDSNP